MLNKRIISSVFCFTVTIMTYGQKAELQKVDTIKEVVNWVRSTAIRIKSVSPSSFAELGFLHTSVKAKKLVLLGEGTHGTKEFFQIRDKIVRYLMLNENFSVLGMEYDMIDGMAVNNYIQNGAGERYDALSRQRGWVWNTEEIAEMIEWMKNENKGRHDKIDYYGIDMFNMLESATASVQYLIKKNVKEVSVVEDAWLKLFTRPLEYFLNNNDEFNKVFNNETSLDTMYRVSEIFKILINIYDTHKDKLIKCASEKDWATYRQLAQIAVQSSKHQRQFNMHSVFNFADWKAEATLYRAIPLFCDSIVKLLGVADALLLNNLSPILERISNPWRGRAYYISNCTTDERYNWKELINSSIARIETRRTIYGSPIPENAFDYILFAFKNILKLFESYTAFLAKPLVRVNEREIGLADNALFLTRHQHKKAIIWAHNLHVSFNQHNKEDDKDFMGTLLKKTIGDSLFVIGTTFNAGSFQAWDGFKRNASGKRILAEFTVTAAKENSIENIMSKAGCEICYLDFSKLPKSGIVHDWFSKKQFMRSIGNYYNADSPDDFYEHLILPNNFNGIIYFDKTSRATPTPFSIKKYIATE